jgi:hypothetical protein
MKNSNLRGNKNKMHCGGHILPLVVDVCKNIGRNRVNKK